MKTQSTEPERLQEQITANRRRLAAYRRKQHRETLTEIPVQQVQLNLIPVEYWEKPIFLQKQAD